jgi:hypothetical protein
MRANDFTNESAVDELKNKLPSLKNTSYDTIDELMQKISRRYKLTGKKLHDLFVHKYGHTPDTWIKKIKNRLSEENVEEAELDEACWTGYHKEGMKTMFGKRYPNCVKNKNESLETYVRKGECPGCGGAMVAEGQLNEKQDACYHKVKSRYKVWPSAYASGALVQCRKKGAANWGNKSNESITQEEYDQLDENLKKWFSDKWVRFGPDGKIKGPCARGDDSEGKPKCLPQSKAHNLGKKGRASAASRKRREDPNPERSGKAINVNTKKKSNEGVAEGKEDKIAQLKKDHETAVYWSKNDTNPHKREAARQKAEKIKGHLEKQYKQGVAEGLSDTQKKIEDTINKLEDRLKHAKSDEQWDNIKDRIERLQAGLNRSKQGVAEGLSEDVQGPDEVQQIKDFIKWSMKTLNVKTKPKFTLSKNTEKAQDGHHTGMHSGDRIWVYIANRNLIDIFRTIFHELVHQRQYELNMIKQGDSYPGSPIEAMADMIAGKYIKIYGKEHPEIFQ